MKIVFISNFMNHHQKDFCDYLYDKSDEFFFVCQSSIPKKTLKLGYEDMSRLPYVIADGEQSGDWIEKKVLEADVVIFGDSSYDYLIKRMKVNKLSFLFSERVWKKGYYRRFIPMCRKKVVNQFSKYANKKLFVLASSCYLAKDIEMMGFPDDKCFTWGYFTPLEIICDPGFAFNQKQVCSIIWVGRLIKLKHLEELLTALSRLKKEGLTFSLSVIGDGPKKEKWTRLAKQLHIEKNVSFKGAMASNKIREEMKKSQIFVATSDFNEGWGAVVNEGMNSVCAPIVSHAMGASAFLISHGENGLIYKSGDRKSLESCLKRLLEHPEETKQMAISAYQTIANVYNGRIAGERFVAFAEGLLNGKTETPYKSGPMSISPLLKNNWINGV